MKYHPATPTSLHALLQPTHGTVDGNLLLHLYLGHVRQHLCLDGGALALGLGLFLDNLLCLGGDEQLGLLGLKHKCARTRARVKE